MRQNNISGHNQSKKSEIRERQGEKPRFLPNGRKGTSVPKAIMTVVSMATEPLYFSKAACETASPAYSGSKRGKRSFLSRYSELIPVDE